MNPKFSTLARLPLALVLAVSYARVGSAQTSTTGTPWIGDPGITQTMAEIEALDRELLRTEHLRHIPHSQRAMVPSPEASTTAVHTVLSTPAPSTGAHGGKAPQTVSAINFTVATLPDCSGFPPDTMGTVGPSQFITALNGRIRSFNKNTGMIDGGINVSSDSFFNSVLTPPTSQNFTSDPRIRYDRISNRWFISMIDVPGRNAALPNRIMLAMSSSGTISNNTTWTFFQFRHDTVGSTPNVDTGAFADYPTMTVDANALYIGVNVFSTSGGYLNTTVYVIRKGSLLSGGPIVVTPFRGLVSAGTGIFTPQPVDNFDPASTEGYVVGTDRTDRSILHLLRISTPGGTPAISPYQDIPIDSYAPAILVPHLGGSGGTNGYLDCVDQRLMCAYFRNGELWTCHNVGVNNVGGNTSVTRNGVQWFAITNVPTGSAPSVTQSGIVYQPTGGNITSARSYWMGSIATSGQGHTAMGFSSSASGEFINAATCGRLATDPLGTMQAPVLYTHSTTIYNPSGDTGSNRGRRWGDYSYTSVDPSDDMTMWTIQEFCSGTGIYGVRVAKLLAPPPPTPTNCSPATVAQGSANVVVVVAGAAATNGAGFFEPGLGFSNHLQLAFGGNGITVNSVAVADPLTLTANLTIAINAQAGARAITVTNPDGQAIPSATGLLTIIPGPINNPPLLAAIPNHTLTPGTTLAFTNSGSDPDSPPENLTFALGRDAPGNATLDPATGAFSWTPDSTQLGTNLFSITVTDDGTPSLSATQTFAVIVVLTNHPPVLAAISNQTVIAGTPVIVTNSATDPDSPPSSLTYSLVSAPFNANINATNGLFTWTPINAQIGTNVISISVADDGLPPLSATQSFSVAVVASNNPPILGAISNRTIHVGTTLLVTNTATDSDLPSQTLTFSLTTSPLGSAIDPGSGVFSWTPGQSFLNSTSSVTVRVTDNGQPPLSDSKSFTIAVISPPVILSTMVSNSNAVIIWSAIPGQTYHLQSKQNVNDTLWNDLPTNVTASAPTATAADPLTNNSRFYRVRVGP